MRTLVFNSKGGCGKSLLVREVIAAPNAQHTVIIEIDSLNKTQLAYERCFNAVIELDKQNTADLLTHLNQYDNVVIDVGINHLSDTLQTIIDYALFDDIDLVVIPMTPGRSDCENALKTYQAIKHDAKKIVFALNRFNPEKTPAQQYPVFFDNLNKIGLKATEIHYIIVNDSEMFTEAQTQKKLVAELADDIDYKTKALEAKTNNDTEQFHALMKKEVNKRAAAILVKNCLLPAYRKLRDIANEQ